MIYKHAASSCQRQTISSEAGGSILVIASRSKTSQYVRRRQVSSKMLVWDDGATSIVAHIGFTDGLRIHLLLSN